MQVKGSSKATTTNAMGHFSLNDIEVNAVLVFSYVGFETQEISVSGRASLVIKMIADSQVLDKVVVIGYGVQRKKDLTGSISVISSDDLKDSRITTPDEALQGRIPGVSVHRNSHEPGGNISVNVNGIASLNASGSPLYVLNGIPISSDFETGLGGINTGRGNSMPGILNSIDASNIESISVLKGPSATAIYGSRGANGVVLITTKMGKEGTNKVDFKTSIGLSKITRKLNFMNAEEYAIQSNERSIALGVTPTYTQQQIDDFGEGTDFQDEILRRGVQQNYNLGFSGGSKSLRYYFAGDYTNDQGIIRNSGLKRYSITSNINSDIGKRLTAGVNLSFTFTDDRKIPHGTKGYQEAPGLISALIWAPPTAPARDENGRPTQINKYPNGSIWGNPLSITDDLFFQNSTNRLIGNVFGVYRIFDDLSLNISLGGDFRNWRYNQYSPKSAQFASAVGGEAIVWDVRNINVVNNNTLNYNKTIGVLHKIDAMVGYTYQKQNNISLYGSANGFPTDAFLYNNLGAASSPLAPNSNASEYKLASYIGRVNYALDDKYLFTASIRKDGDSKFGANKRYGVFPSAAFAWQIGNEDLFKEIDAISMLKLRIGWGKTGNESIGYYSSYALINNALNSNQSYIYDASLQGIAFVSNMANPDLGWEKTSGWNIGIESGFFNNRLLFNLTYYNKNTTDLILEVPVPRQSGFASVLKNTGSMRNEGIEIQVNSINIRNSIVNWSTGITFSSNRNRVLSLGGDSKFIYTGWTGGNNLGSHGSNTTRIEVGHPVGSFYGRIYDGIWQSEEQIVSIGTDPAAVPGDVRWRDVNKDGKIDGSDEMYIGNALPDFEYGVINNFEYKRWNLHVFAYGVYGNDVLNMPAAKSKYYPIGVSAERVNNRWSPNNPEGYLPGVGASGWGAAYMNSSFLERGSFLRIQTVSLNYNIPVINKQLRSVSLGLAADNLAVFTKYTGYDPEVNSGGMDNRVKGVDLFAYPASRGYRFIFKLGF